MKPLVVPLKDGRFFNFDLTERGEGWDLMRKDEAVAHKVIDYLDEYLVELRRRFPK